jgi:hypothetical protein
MAYGGTPRLTLQDTDGGAGNVGILFKESTNDKWTLASVGGAFQFFNEATASNALYITASNNVGIGTSSPIFRLDIQNNTQAIARILDTSTNSSLILQAGTGSGMKITGYNYNTSTAVPLYISVDGANTILQSGGGNTLIGTTTDAGQKLQVNGITKTNGISLAKTSFSSSTTMTDAFFSWSFGGAIGQTLTLYNSSGHTNMHFIKNESSISLTIAAHSGGVIMGLTSNSGSSSITLAAFKTVQLISFGGSAWYIMYQTT